MQNDKPTRGRPKTLEKDAVTDVAMKAYWEDGPTQVSLNDICGRAGVSKPSLYREFGNDDGLAHAALQKYAETVMSKMLSIVAGDAAFADKIRQIAYLSAADRLHEQGCLFVKMRAVKAQMGPQTQALIEQIEEMASTAFSELLDKTRASGEWSSPIPVELATTYLFAQIRLALDERARGNDPREVLDLALSVLLDPET